MKKKALLVLAAFMLVLLAACGKSESTNTDKGKKDEAYAPETLRVQFVPTKSESTADAKAKPLAELLSKELGIPVEVSVSTDYSTIIEAMASKQIDLGIMPPNAYVLAKDRGAANAILQSELYDVKQPGGQKDETKKVSSFRGQIIYKKDSGIKGYEDLKGKTIAAQDVVSASGYVFPVAEMIKAGMDVDRDVSFVTVNGIDNAILAVINGDADAAFSFEDGRNLMLKDYPNIHEELDSFFTEARIPNDAIAVRTDMDKEWIEKIRKAFIAIGESEDGREIVEALYGHVGYVEADDSSYDVIREYGELVGQ
ncbi:phosphonate transport system substrate-binding protein [Sporosarcina luteola]|nr:phosphonate transport system substrate-binding protein [Sporosarcina luteola]